MRFRFALLQITWDRPDPEPKTDQPPIEASGGHNFERAEPRRIGFGGDELPDHEGRNTMKPGTRRGFEKLVGDLRNSKATGRNDQ